MTKLLLFTLLSQAALWPKHHAILDEAGWLPYVLESVDELVYVNKEHLEGTVVGRARRENGRRVAIVTTKGQDDLEVTATIVHEAAHLHGLDEESAQRVEKEFLADFAAAQREESTAEDEEEPQDVPQATPADEPTPQDEPAPRSLVVSRPVPGVITIRRAGIAQAPRGTLPAGTLISLHTTETLSTKASVPDDPVLFEVARDVRAFRNTRVLVPKNSLVVARVALVDRAGHFVGRSELGVRFEALVLPDGRSVTLNARLVEIDGQKVVRGGIIQGRGHAKRDAFFLAFLPTTLFQLLALPGRGPDILIRPETSLLIKLLRPIEF